MKSKDPTQIANRLAAMLVRYPVFLDPKDVASSITPSSTPKAADKQRGNAKS